MPWSRFVALVAFLITFLSAVPLTAGASGPANPKEFGDFADQIMMEQMSRNHIPGAVLVAVKDGHMFYAKGYGYADLERQIPWDPDRTVLRAKSISKSVTATAAMQLYERGQLKLDADINNYFGSFKIPPTFPSPVTASNLLTHTGGFADRGIATNARDAAGLTSLEQYLALDRYPRIYPPGDRISYGDHGFVMLGYLVETISKKPYPQYVEENIFRPLGMQRSTFQQPWPEDLARDMAMGYIYVNGSYIPQPAGFIKVYPASGMLTTGTDMGRFMLAHLQDGRYDGGQILKAATAQEMHSQQFTQHPKLAGLTYGFQEDFTHGQRALMHVGEGLGFANWLYMLPNQQMGFFIATNRKADFSLQKAFTEAFLDRYFPGNNSSPKPMTGYQDRVARYTGVYKALRHDPRMLEKQDQEDVIIRTNGDGTLSAMGGRWVEVEPLLFQRVDGEELLAFREDGNGKITDLFSGDYPWAYQKGHWYDASLFRLPLLGISVLVFLSVLIAWPIRVWLALRGRPDMGQVKKSPRLAWMTAGVTSFLNVLFLALLTPTIVVQAQGGAADVHYGLPPIMVGGLVIPLVTTALTGVLIVFAFLSWRRGYWSTLVRIHYTAVTLAAMAFVWSCAYLNMIGFHY